VPFARFFVAKAILNVAATRDMIARVGVDSNLHRILGWEIGKRLPDESAFSRVKATIAHRKTTEPLQVVRHRKDPGHRESGETGPCRERSAIARSFVPDGSSLDQAISERIRRIVRISGG